MLNKLEVNSAIQGASPCRQLPQRLECPAVIPFQDDLDVWIQFGVAGSDRSDRLGSPMQADGCRLRQLLRNVVRFLGTTFQFNSIQFWSHVLWAETNAGCLTNTEHLILKKKHQRTWQEHQRTSKNSLSIHFLFFLRPGVGLFIKATTNQRTHCFFSILLSRESEISPEGNGAGSPIATSGRAKKKQWSRFSDSWSAACCWLLTFLDTEGLRHWLLMTFHINPAPCKYVTS